MSDYFPRGNTLSRERQESEHGFFRVTHHLVYEREVIAELCLWRGQYYTREGYGSGEPGINREDLHEGEQLKRVRDTDYPRVAVP